jgi:hypothetical protein
MRKLYEIDKSIEDVLNALTDPDTGELIETESLDSLLLEREQKIESVILYRKDVSAEMAAVDAEIATLTARKKRLAKTCDGLDVYLGNALGGQKFSTARCEATFRKSEVADIKPEDVADFVLWAKKEAPELVTHKETDAPNKMEIKKLLKAGTLLPYCSLVVKQNITIK